MRRSARSQPLASLRPAPPAAPSRLLLLWLAALVALGSLGSLGAGPALASAATPVARATPPAVAPCPLPELGGTPVASFPRTVTDDAGRQVVLAETPQRIVSVAPSNTEILYALGLGDRVVAVDQYSDFPAEAVAKATLGGYVDPDLEAIAAAEPDLVLATGVHEPTLLPELEGLGLAAVVVEPNTLEEVFAGIDLVGRATGAAVAAARLACQMRTRIDAVAAAVAGEPRPRVFFELSPELHSAGPGSFVDDLITRAGGTNVAAGAAEEWPQLDAEALVAADPQVILLADHEAGVTPEQVAARPGWRAVAAVAAGRVAPIDPDLTNRPGPRVVDGLEAIARALHPDRVPPPAGRS